MDPPENGEKVEGLRYYLPGSPPGAKEHCTRSDSDLSRFCGPGKISFRPAVEIRRKFVTELFHVLREMCHFQNEKAETVIYIEQHANSYADISLQQANTCAGLTITRISDPNPVYVIERGCVCVCELCGKVSVSAHFRVHALASIFMCTRDEEQGKQDRGARAGRGKRLDQVSFSWRQAFL